MNTAQKYAHALTLRNEFGNEGTLTGTVDAALVPTVVSVIVVDDAGFVVVSVSRCCRVAEEGGGEEGGQGVGGKDRRLKMALGFTSSAVWNTERRYNYILWNYI